MNQNARYSWQQLLDFVENLKTLKPSDRLNKLRQVHEGLTEEPHKGNWVQCRARIREIINERIGKEGADFPATWDPIQGRLERERDEVPNRDPQNEPILPNGLNTPVIKVFKRLQRSEVTVDGAIDELRKLAKIAGTAAAIAVLQDLLKRFLDKDRVKTQEYQSFELEILQVARAYPAKIMEKPKATSSVDPGKDDKKMSDDPNPIEPDAGNDQPETIVVEPPPQRVEVVREYSSDRSGNGVALGLLGLAAAAIIAAALIAFALIWGNDSDSSSLASANAGLNGGNPGSANSGNTNGGSNTNNVKTGTTSSEGNFSIGCGDKNVGAVQSLIGLSVVCLGTEYDAYTWRSVPIAVDAMCPDGYICTLHLADGDKIIVTQTPGKYSIVAGTFRRIKGYPSGDAVNNACQLLMKEKTFGASQNPSFDVFPHGFTCDGTTAVMDSKGQTSSGDLTKLATADLVSKVVGGSASNWSALPDSNGKGWKYKGPATNLTVPSSSRIDHPSGSANPGETVSASEATLWILS